MTEALNRILRHKLSIWLVATLTFTTTGCSVFLSTPQMASYQIQRLDNSFVEMVIRIDEPTETNLDIRLNNRYTLQLEFDWLLNMEETPRFYEEAKHMSEDPLLTPWMMCKYRF
jgi:hypothetical protein